MVSGFEVFPHLGNAGGGVVGDVSQRLWRNALDKTVGRIFGFAIRPTTTQRQQRLFEVYVEMIEKDQLLPRTAERKTQRKS